MAWSVFSLLLEGQADFCPSNMLLQLDTAMNSSMVHFLELTDCPGYNGEAENSVLLSPTGWGPQQWQSDSESWSYIYRSMALSL